MQTKDKVKSQQQDLSRELFLYCYRDEYDLLVVAIKKKLRENEEQDVAHKLNKDTIKKSCPEDAWLPIQKFDTLTQNEKYEWSNQVDVHGRTLLHYCCGSKQELAPLAARYLLDSRASLLMCDADGKFPVHYLARQGNVLMFERCPEFLIVVDQKTKNDLAETPYDVAKSKGQTGFTSFLLAKCPWIAASVQKKELRRKSLASADAHSSDSPMSIRSRRPSSARSSDAITYSPTGSKRNSLRSEDSEVLGLNFYLEGEEQTEDLVERLPSVPSTEDLLANEKKENSDVDELYRIAGEFSRWDPLMSKALVLRWLKIYVYTSGSSMDIILKPHSGNALIHLAIINGCTDVVIILLKFGASVDVQNEDGHTPLHLASMLGFTDIVLELLKVGADVHRQDKDGCIPVELIPNTSEGFQIVMLMFRFASTLSIDDDTRDPSLLESMIEKQHFEIVNLLLLMRPSSAFYINPKGETLLHCTAKAPYDDTAILTGKVLVSLGIDARIKNSNGLTALEMCSELYSPLSSFLSDSLAIHVQRMQGIWHLAQLTKLGYWNDQKLFEESSKNLSFSDRDSAKSMTLRGSYGSIKHLFKTDSDCNNLLHRACSIGAVALAQKLLMGGLAGMPRNLNGDTPLHVAAFNGHNDIILCLFAVSFSKALLHSRNKHGFSAFDLAAFQGHIPVLATFLSWGYTEKFEKISPKSLFAAFAGKQWQVITFLLENLPHESRLCLDQDDNNFLHYTAALKSQDAVKFFEQLPQSKFCFLFEKRCLKKKNAINLDPFELAGKNHNVTFLGFFRKYCSCCIVCCARQCIARRRLREIQSAAVQSAVVWKVQGFPFEVSKGFILWTALGAIIEILDRAIFIRKIMPKGVAELLGLSVGSFITSLWNLSTCDYRIVRILKQPHSEHFHLHGMFALQISSSHVISLEKDEIPDECMFCLENGDVVRLSEHEYEETDGNHVFKFAATANNRVSTPFTHQNLMKMEGPHMIMKIVSMTGANSCSESHLLLKHVISREELQLHFHPESDGMTNLLFAPLQSLGKAIKTKPAGRKGSVSMRTGELRERLKQKKVQKDLLDALSIENKTTLMADDESYFEAMDFASFDAKSVLYRPDIELFETAEKLADVLLPCTVIAAVASDCQYEGAERIQCGDQIIDIDAHRTMNLKTAQGYLEGKKGSIVTITVSRASPMSESAKVQIIRAKIVRSTYNSWLSWVESTILLQKIDEKQPEITERENSEKKSFAETVGIQQMASCEAIAEKMACQELSRLEICSVKHLPHRYAACNGLFLMQTSASTRIKSVYRAHIVRRSIVCNFTIRQSLREKSKSTERILMTNGIATQQVVEWWNSGLLGESPLQYCIENGHSEGLLQLIHYGCDIQSSWLDVLRKARMFYSLMDSAVESSAAKASLILVQELGMLPILENSTFTQAEKAIFVMSASIKYSAVDIVTTMIQNPSVMQCLGESNVQGSLSMAIDRGRVEIVRAILESRPRMACLRLVSFPNESALKFVLLKTKMPKRSGSSTNPLCFDFAVISMLYSFAKFGCVLFSQSDTLNPLGSYLAPSLVENLQNFATFREAEVLKAIANGLAVRCRNRNEEKMINGLKLLHETRQKESRDALSAKKRSAWSKIESAQGMVTLAKNFRVLAIESNLDKDKRGPPAKSQNFDRELLMSASRMRIEGKSVPQTGQE